MQQRCNRLFSVAFLLATLSPLASPLFAPPLPPAAIAEFGVASIYSDQITANGEYAYASDFTAAHKTLPLGTYVEVTNLINGRSVIVRINDRGPFIDGRIIDLTPAGAEAIGFTEAGAGLAPVALTVFGGVDDGAPQHPGAS